jgi:hypothetical protein
MSADFNSVFYCSREALDIVEPKGLRPDYQSRLHLGISGISSNSPNYSAAKGSIKAFTGWWDMKSPEPAFPSIASPKNILARLVG